MYISCFQEQFETCSCIWEKDVGGSGGQDNNKEHVVSTVKLILIMSYSLMPLLQIDTSSS